MLDVYLSGPTRGAPDYGGPRVSFDDNAYYWFLYPFFEAIHDQTQQMFDLYGDATFKGQSLKVLLRLTERAREIALQQPEQWLMCTGRRTGSEQPGPTFAPVHRKELVKLISELHALVVAAIQQTRAVVCVGD